eukprot:4626583-Pleurochrysis_carterae.AAC.1
MRGVCLGERAEGAIKRDGKKDARFAPCASRPRVAAPPLQVRLSVSTLFLCACGCIPAGIYADDEQLLTRSQLKFPDLLTVLCYSRRLALRRVLTLSAVAFAYLFVPTQRTFRA